jgi:hypothetical protein
LPQLHLSLGVESTTCVNPDEIDVINQHVFEYTVVGDDGSGL